MADLDEDELPGGTPEAEVKAKDAEPWLKLIADAEKAFKDWNDRSDNIDKLYANLAKLANPVRDRQMSLFWANMQTLGPSVYARPPVPVVMPRFKDRKPILRSASELLERTTIVSYETQHVDRTLKQVRDDLTRLGRGVVWQRYETSKEKNKPREKVCAEFKFRRDFLHDPARCWGEVDWVDGISYLTRKEMRKRFSSVSGKAYQDAEYSVRKDAHDSDYGDTRKKARVHEIWCKSENKVIWVADGCEYVLEEAEPHLTLDDFFPCPEPAYGTKQPESLIPVPDVLQYKDQLEEINQLTNRIHALADAIKVRAFYPAGAGELGDAIQSAMAATNDNQVVVPVSNWAMLGNGSPKDMLVWLPIDQIAKTVAELVQLRQQLIQDVYEISGISDILRGQTDPNETLGAQQLKAQTGSTRVRAMQEEMVRLARDMTRIDAEIIAEEFNKDTLLEMSQLDLPSDADIAKQVKELTTRKAMMEQALEQAMQSPEIRQQAEANPEEAQKALQEAEGQINAIQQQIDSVSMTVTIDQVMKLLREQRIRPFLLDIETDSTIAPDENAQKERMVEYVTAMSSLFQQAVPAVQQVPQMAPMMAEIIKKANGVFRMGREFEQVIEEFTESMKQAASQPNPAAQAAQAAQQMEQQKLQIETQKAQATAMKAEADAKRADADTQVRMAELAAMVREQEQGAATEAAKTRAEIEKTLAQVDEIRAKIEKMGVDAANQTRQQDREDVRTVADIAGQQQDRAMAREDQSKRFADGDRQAALTERQQEFAERQADKGDDA